MVTVGILGVVHDDELRVNNNLPLEFIKELILEFNPDVICGEVLPASWEKYKEDPTNRGYWGEPPSEYWNLIFPLCEEKQFKFVPIDWVELDVWLDFDPFKDLESSQLELLEDQSEQWWQQQLAAARTSVIPFNSLEFDQVTKQKYQWLETINPESHAVRWVCRHHIMIQRIRNAISDNPDARILCIVGADHNHALYEGLIAQENVQLIYPLK
ncbi:hypothetical protein A8L34_08420 [Bacillus sp. FJAT-27264]|uniref:hypothetical protein n=1 Tax=Paenibacillus sp. (strain DSM 101736 / FJAT-27264) TaxID=1850362 RepID=UPI000807D886|nr:hypothetical protein [Bacillus sp. FJAT-27264]OBZ13990.1 hypothetical protein A8L34_08420 [Bacillus sp. FJAT-27264]